jgi:hypothetical protein
MIIESFPPTMWKNITSGDKAPAVKRAWKLKVTCGSLGDPDEGMPKLSGCGGKLTLTKKDYYQKSHGDGRTSFWFMCPCCATENPIPITELELNNKVPEKADWLEARREAIIAELLLGKGLPDGCTVRTEKLLRKIKAPFPDCYEPSETAIATIEE